MAAIERPVTAPGPPVHPYGGSLGAVFSIQIQATKLVKVICKGL